MGMKPVAAGCEATAEGLRNEDALAAAKLAARIGALGPDGAEHQFRRLAERWERRTDIHHGFLALAYGLITWRRLPHRMR